MKNVNDNGGENVVQFPLPTGKSENPPDFDRIRTLSVCMKTLLDGEKSEIGLHVLALTSAAVLDVVHSNNDITRQNLAVFQREVADMLWSLRDGGGKAS